MGNYFGGVDFVTWGEFPRSTDVQRERYFDGYYGLQFVYHGRLEYSVGGAPARIFSGCGVLVTRPGIPFSYAAPGGGSRYHIFVCFRGERLGGWLDSGLLPLPQEVIPITAPEAFYWTLHQLIERLDRPGGASSPRAVLLLEDLLLQLHEQPDRGVMSEAQREKLTELAARIQRHPEREWDWGREARRLALSPVHFRRQFKLLTGFPPLAFRTECRLQLAAKLLLSPDAAVGEVARAAGFADEFYFSRLFTRHRGITPSAYRKTYG